MVNWEGIPETQEGARCDLYWAPGIVFEVPRLERTFWCLGRAVEFCLQSGFPSEIIVMKQKATNSWLNHAAAFVAPEIFHGHVRATRGIEWWTSERWLNERAGARFPGAMG
jgi:hypothetical protein